MSSTRRFRASDLFEFNRVNLDILTETVLKMVRKPVTNAQYNISFYLSYLARWPSLFSTILSPDGKIMGYIMGKTEGRGQDWHGHVTAVTVAPTYRRLGLARKMMRLLETASEAQDAYFVDLFVRSSNTLAIEMYRSFGYVVYRRVVDYYSSSKGPDEDAFDMRIPLKRDADKSSIRGHGENNRIEADAFPDYSI